MQSYQDYQAAPIPIPFPLSPEPLWLQRAHPAAFLAFPTPFRRVPAEGSLHLILRPSRDV